MNRRLVQLAAAPPSRRMTGAACTFVAGGVHAALALCLPAQPPDELPALVTTVELEPDKPAPVATRPAPPPPAASVRPEPVPPREHARRAPERASAAHAGRVLTAPDLEPPRGEDPVRFVSDPDGRSYGTGIVARATVAEHGEADGASSETPPSAAAHGGLQITPTDRLRRQPMLLGDGCRGFFPEHARPDQGLVSIVVTLRPNGSIAALTIEAETPPDEGFAESARACLAAKRFQPALDERGQPTAARTRVKLRFTR